ncbi:MAG TPA: hypothetical protein VMU58_08745 [Gaiellaceae bacterium]|nr:hypothetical protein [Gaiellaceae bacterium]
MLKRIAVIGALILALMVVVKDGRVLRDVGLTGSCSVAQTYTDGTQLEACRAGKLAGRPDLSRDSCRNVGVTGTYDYWHCPASLGAGPNGG